MNSPCDESESKTVDVPGDRKPAAGGSTDDRMLREILDHSRDILYRRDLRTGGYPYLSRSFGDILGYSQPEVDGMGFAGIDGLIHPDDRKGHDRYLQHLLDTPGAVDPADGIEYRMRGKNGTYRWFRDHMTVVRDPDGRPSFLVGNSRDITDRRKTQHALQAAHERMLTVLDSIDAHVYVADLSTYQILLMNRKMKEDFGHGLEGKICWQVFRGAQGPCDHCTNDRLLDARGQATEGCRWEGRNPLTGRWYVNHDRAIRWIDDRWARLQIAVDITEVKRLEQERIQALEQLRQVQKIEAIGTLAGGIAHDFNNLLMGIMGHLNLMKIDMAPDHPHQRRIAKVEEMVLSGSRLTGQLLGYAQQGKYEVQPMDLNRIAAEVLEAFGRTRKDITVRLDLAPDLAPVSADKGQMTQVLWNLCANASEAMPQGGTLSVATSNQTVYRDGRSDARVVLTMADTGHGMAPGTCQRIFEPFFSTKPRGKATGMGLATVYGVIRGHDGQIDVQSTPGQGTCFTLCLPAAAALAPRPVPDSGGAGIKTVLLVDDEEFVRDIGQELLTHLGFATLVAENGNRAVEIFAGRRNDIHLVILDLIMPQMSGGETFDRLKAIDAGVKVLLASGYSLEGEARSLLDRGCDGFIQKPYSITDLKAKIGQILAAAPPVRQSSA